MLHFLDIKEATTLDYLVVEVGLARRSEVIEYFYATSSGGGYFLPMYLGLNIQSF